MTEHRLYDPENPPDFFDDAWYDTRPHAPHLEQGAHVTRLHDAADAVIGQVQFDPELIQSVVDLGAGDGGLLSLIRKGINKRCWGYDLQMSNITYAQNSRYQDVTQANFMTDPILWGDLAVITECLEHLPDPHAAVRLIGEHCRAIVASSPVNEGPGNHDACHAWAWDMDGYRALIEQGGYEVVEHFVSDPNGYGFQVISGRK